MSYFKEIFSRDIEIDGSHSEKIKFLIGASVEKIEINFFGDNKDDLTEVKIFPTLADAFMVSAAVGFINSNYESEDKVEGSSRIFSDKARKISSKLEEIYQVMVFTDEKFKKLDLRNKFEKAFSSENKNDKKEDKQLLDYFLSYARSGIDFLYEKAIKISSLTDLLKFYNDIISNYSHNVND
jgi:hypothetical protein